MTRDEAIQLLLTTVHEAAGNLMSRKFEVPKNPVLAAELKKRQDVTDETLAHSLLDAWEKVVIESDPPLLKTTRHECGPERG